METARKFLNVAFVGPSAATAAPDNAHVMSQVDTNFGFFEYTGEIPANKAYYVE